MRICTRCGEPLSSDWPCTQCGFAPRVAADGTASFVDDLGDGDEYQDEFFGLLARIEDESFWFAARNRVIVWALKRYGTPLESFLEVGCGTGFVLHGIREAFPDTRLCGAELFPGGLPYARERVPDAELIQADARALPFREEFAAAGAFDVLEHIADDEAALHGIREAVSPGSLFLATVPQHPWLWSATDEVAMHKRRYTRRDLRLKVERAGFETVRLTSFVTLLVPLMAASRVMRGNAKTPGDVASELQATRRLNRVLAAIMTAERAGIRAGLSLPVGGSLLLVARRI